MLRKALTTIALLGCAQSAMAREFPVELMRPWFAAVTEACSKKDPPNAKYYKTGLALMMKRHPEAAHAVVDKTVYPNVDKSIKHDIETMDERALARDCRVLYDLAGEVASGPPDAPPPK
ncbi:hypothetical protein [Massilia sp. CF038]|uniref:hypothetical protein n=1 Tax=Massilia sp. CF038 TaxID=1881045 RepID=UPI00091C2387|nr:hypothetical protein [Massilia sp. CF038]SHH23977.1 hypothetical protein SAMN05428948_3465 [Massilia sp. CF038]